MPRTAWSVLGKARVLFSAAARKIGGRCRATGNGREPPIGIVGGLAVLDPYADIETMWSFDVKGALALEE